MDGLVKFETQELGSKYIDSIKKKFHLDENELITHYDPNQKQNKIEELLQQYLPDYKSEEDKARPQIFHEAVNQHDKDLTDEEILNKIQKKNLEVFNEFEKSLKEPIEVSSSPLFGATSISIAKTTSSPFNRTANISSRSSNTNPSPKYVKNSDFKIMNEINM